MIGQNTEVSNCQQPKPTRSKHRLVLRPRLTSEDRSKGEEHTQKDVPGHGSVVVNNLTLGDGEDDPKHLERHREDWEQGPGQLAHRRTEPP